MLHKYLARTLALPDRFEWKKKMVGGSGGMPEMLIRGNEVFEHFLAFLSFSLQKKAQIVRQPSGTGIDFSMINEIELKGDADEVYPLAVRAEAYPSGSVGRSEVIDIRSRKAQITFAMFEKKELGVYQVSAEGNETAKECIICLCKSRNTIVLPCRHLCLCSNCAKILSFKSSQCPICRKPVERFLEIDIAI
ncbi:hypothetical protein Pfo_007215 [Paulownia fortunei]|nr:hypothetical protein Pfo_007215 [Paulownia fortunei]